MLHGESDHSSEILLAEWLCGGNEIQIEDRVAKFTKWLGKLDVYPQKIRDFSILSSFEFKIYPVGPFPSPPQPSSWVYGHLPFAGLTAADDIFYRWEPFPVSKRIDQKKKTIAPGTFTAPLSEVPFMPTGFSAVARLALPGLLPACFRWELRPAPKTKSRCGASVPMYGQSGGGVEVVFPTGFKNTGPISNPVILPAL